MARERIEIGESGVQTSAKVHGSTVDVEGVTDKQLRLIIRKFLHSRSMDEYRTVSEPGQVEILPPRPELEHVKIDKRVTAQAARRCRGISPALPSSNRVGRSSNS